MQTEEERRRKNREKYDRWRTNNREAYLEAQRRNKAKNGHKWREKDKARAKAWRAANLEKARARELAYRENNRAKACAREKARRIANPERKSAADKAYRIANREKLKAYHVEYSEKNSAALRASARQRYNKNRESISAASKAKYAEDPTPFLAKNKAARLKPGFSEKNAERVKRRKETSVQFKLSCAIRSRIKKCLSKEYRKGGTLLLLGNTVDGVKRHLESLFLPGMTWDNYGYRGWHIDHIVPLSSADLTNSEEVAKVCHYTNLQPLWWLDNIRKHNRIVSSHITAARVARRGV